jgi:DNA polymerase-3 subunit delta'
MLLGHEDKKKIFQKLIENGRLAQGYLFFGESHVGKFLFAKSLANFLENKHFEEPKSILTETLIVQPENGSIGIDAVRNSKQFLSRKPLYSAHRILIINDAETLTNQAQNAILKLAEEPPRSSLIIIIALGPDAILPTLQSRLQKIYFSRVKLETIEKALISHYGFEPKKAVMVAKESLGKPGLAIDVVQNEADKDAEELVRKLFGTSQKRKTIEAAIENPALTSRFLTKVIARLSSDPIKYYKILGKIMDRLVKMSDFTTNKRLQLESALWNI